jgi:ABC-2 type transport system permease protein
VVAASILFGTTSMLAVTVTFEKKNRSFERLLLAPIPFELLMGQNQRCDLVRHGQRVCSGHHGPISGRSFSDCLSGLHPGRFSDRGGINVSGAIHRAVAVSDVFEAQTLQIRIYLN